MVTPQDIKDRSFTKAVFGGYDMGGVDDFIDKLSDDYESLYKENAILKSKLKVLVEKVEEYRSTEDAMRMALLNAKKMADEMLEDARKKADTMLRSTESGMVSKAKDLQKQLENEDKKLRAAQKVTAEFVDMSMSLCKQHVNFLQKLGELRESDLKEEARTVPINPDSEASIAAAKEIESSVTRVYGNLQEDIKKASAPKTEPPKVQKSKVPEGWDDEEEPTNPRPKFEFRDLKFGDNYEKE
jgi:DivIVA domain